MSTDYVPPPPPPAPPPPKSGGTIKTVLLIIGGAFIALVVLGAIIDMTGEDPTPVVASPSPQPSSAVTTTTSSPAAVAPVEPVACLDVDEAVASGKTIGRLVGAAGKAFGNLDIDKGRDLILDAAAEAKHLTSIVKEDPVASSYAKQGAEHLRAAANTVKGETILTLTSSDARAYLAELRVASSNITKSAHAIKATSVEDC